jgi:hypothetical protein
MSDEEIHQKILEEAFQAAQKPGSRAKPMLLPSKLVG